MADIPLEPHQVSDTQERTLQEVVNELRELNSAQEMAQDSALYTQELRDYITSKGDKLSSSQVEAIEDLITAIEGNNLEDMEKSMEEIKRDDERNELLEAIAKYTSLSLDTMKEEFDGKSRGIIMRMLINAAIRGVIVGFIKGIYDSYKFLGKGFVAIASRIGKFLKLDVFFSMMANQVKSAMAGARNQIRAIFGGSGKPGMFGRLLNNIRQGIRSAMPFIKDMGKIFKSVGTFGSAMMLAMTRFFTGMLAPIKALTRVEAPKFATTFFKTGAAAFARFFKPMNDFFKIFTGIVTPLTRQLNVAGKMVAPMKNLKLGTSIGRFFAALKPLKLIGDTLGAVAKAFAGIGRVLGRFFLPITIIMGLIDGIKGATGALDQYKDASIVEKIFVGLMGAIGGILKGLVGIPLDLLKSLIGWIAGKLGMDGVQEFLSSFSFADMIQTLFDTIIHGVMGFIDKIRTAISEVGVGGLIKNAMVELLKIFKKIVTFPHAVAAGAVGAIKGAFNPSKSAMEGFKEGFEKVFNLGDAAMDNLKATAEGDNGAGEGAEMQQLSEENSRFDSMREGLGNFIGDIGNKMGFNNTDNSQTQVIINDQSLIPKASSF